MVARPGACDQEAENSIHTPSSARAPRATPVQGLTPKNGRSTVAMRTASAIASTTASGAHVFGKKPPAWKPSTATSSPGSRAGSTIAALRARAIEPSILRALGGGGDLDHGRRLAVRQL